MNWAKMVWMGLLLWIPYQVCWIMMMIMKMIIKLTFNYLVEELACPWKATSKEEERAGREPDLATTTSIDQGLTPHRKPTGRPEHVASVWAWKSTLKREVLPGPEHALVMMLQRSMPVVIRPRRRTGRHPINVALASEWSDTWNREVHRGRERGLEMKHHPTTHPRLPERHPINAESESKWSDTWNREVHRGRERGWARRRLPTMHRTITLLWKRTSFDQMGRDRGPSGM
mmetsp:Transcript_12647/g.27323  ORF Transcript_12647/g.27323 Transcript_12647/m.27323 type:complete len:230 (+) Transcript_12647:180-869(+)